MIGASVPYVGAWRWGKSVVKRNEGFCPTIIEWRFDLYEKKSSYIYVTVRLAGFIAGRNCLCSRRKRAKAISVSKAKGKETYAKKSGNKKITHHFL